MLFQHELLMDIARDYAALGKTHQALSFGNSVHYSAIRVGDVEAIIDSLTFVSCLDELAQTPSRLDLER